MIRLPLAAITSACMASLMVVATAASAQTAAAPDAVRIHAADQAFITDATKAVSTQRDAARIATSRSTDRDVKAFAERVSNDNAKISDQEFLLPLKSELNSKEGRYLVKNTISYHLYRKFTTEEKITYESVDDIEKKDEPGKAPVKKQP